MFLLPAGDWLHPWWVYQISLHHCHDYFVLFHSVCCDAQVLTPVLFHWQAPADNCLHPLLVYQLSLHHRHQDYSYPWWVYQISIITMTILNFSTPCVASCRCWHLCRFIGRPLLMNDYTLCWCTNSLSIIAIRIIPLPLQGLRLIGASA